MTRVLLPAGVSWPGPLQEGWVPSRATHIIMVCGTREAIFTRWTQDRGRTHESLNLRSIFAILSLRSASVSNATPMNIRLIVKSGARSRVYGIRSTELEPLLSLCLYRYPLRRLCLVARSCVGKREGGDGSKVGRSTRWTEWNRVVKKIRSIRRDGAHRND